MSGRYQVVSATLGIQIRSDDWTQNGLTGYMQAEQLFLNFYEVVRLRVEAPRKTIEFLRSEWNSFCVSPSNAAPHIFARIRPWRDGREASSKLAKTLITGTFRGCYKGYQWRAVTYQDGETTTVDYSAMPKSSLLLKDSMLEPLVMKLLAEHGLFGFHASAANINGKAWMICGSSKSGKTAMALISHRNGHPILSDDTCVLGRDALYPYPSPPRIYLRTLRPDRLLEGLLPGDVLARLMVNGLVSLGTLGQLRIPTRLTSESLDASSPRNPRPIRLGGLIFLRMTDESISVSPAAHNDAIRETLQSHQSEHASAFLRLVTRAAESTPDRGAFSERLLDSMTEEKRCIIVTLKRRMVLEEWNALFSEIERYAKSLDAGVA